MHAFQRVRSAFFVFAALTALALPVAAAGSHGGDGGGGSGGGGGTTAAPAVTFTPTSLTFGAQAIGTTSPSQSITITNSGNASLFINSAATRGANPLDFTQVADGCSGLTLAAGTSCSVAITFKPTATGTRSATFILTDNAAGSPQTVPITGTGTGQNPPLAIDNRFFTCTNGVCDIGAGSNVFVNNFFSTSFLASGGTAPYTWSGQAPAGLTLRSSGRLGAPSVKGASTFTVTVTDATGATATGTFSLTATDAPPPTPPGCQTGRVLKESLTGAAFNGRRRAVRPPLTKRGSAAAAATASCPLRSRM